MLAVLLTALPAGGCELTEPTRQQIASFQLCSGPTRNMVKTY